MAWIEEELSIQGNKKFKRLEMQTQVLLPKFGETGVGVIGRDVAKNRMTHSFEVASVAEYLASNLQYSEANWHGRLRPVSLLHDIGHPPFGHEGAKVLDTWCREKGLDEGFDDNNNNFVVIRKNGIDVSDYTLASLIKYPEKLYESQKRLLLPLLDRAIDLDLKAFEGVLKPKKRPKRTIACEIMDKADRISYTCSDLADGVALGIIDPEPFERVLNENRFVSAKIRETLLSLAYGTEKGEKGLVNSALNKARLLFASNYYVDDNLGIKPIDEETEEFMEVLSKITFDEYIHSEEVNKERDQTLGFLVMYLNWVDEGNYPSSTYRKLIKKSRGKNRLRFIRDMVAETTDWFVIETMRKEIRS